MTDHDYILSKHLNYEKFYEIDFLNELRYYFLNVYKNVDTSYCNYYYGLKM